MTTAAKRGMAPAEVVRACVEVMTALNDRAAATAVEAGASAMTDVTGFGLLGHLHEMTIASGVAARVESARVPLIEGALELIEAGALAGGSRRNRAWVEPHVEFGPQVAEPMRALLCDAMTSGGLLVCAPPGRDLAGAQRIGEIKAGPAGQIQVS